MCPHADTDLKLCVIWATRITDFKKRTVSRIITLCLSPSATKDLDDPENTAEKVGISALIVQVGSDYVTIWTCPSTAVSSHMLDFKDCCLRMIMRVLCCLLSCLLRTSRAPLRLITNLTGTGCCSRRETRGCSYSTHTLDWAGEKRRLRFHIYLSQ